jgi:hypothetical protein
VSQPDSPWLLLPIGLVCAALSYACHRLLQQPAANTFMPIDAGMKGDAGSRLLFRSIWPFRDLHHYQSTRRFYARWLLFGWKWVLAFAAGVTAIYPVIYMARFGGR